MRKIVQYLVFLVLGVLTACSFTKKSEIISTDNDEYVESILNEADQNTLVIFDCNNILFTPKDAIFHQNNSEILQKVYSYLKGKFERKIRMNASVELGKQIPLKLLNKNLPSTTQNLQAKGVRVLLLTNYWAGKFYGMERIQDLRKEQLARFNFDFKRSWRDCSNFTFLDLPKVIKDTTLYPTFDDGIIFTCTVDKGTVLEHFLKRIPMRFSRVVFIDDKMKNIQSVSKVCQQLEIPYIGIEYTKVRNMKIRTADFDTECKRFEDFTKTNQWKSDPKD